MNLRVDVCMCICVCVVTCVYRGVFGICMCVHVCSVVYMCVVCLEIFCFNNITHRQKEDLGFVLREMLSL